MNPFAHVTPSQPRGGAAFKGGQHGKERKETGALVELGKKCPKAPPEGESSERCRGLYVRAVGVVLR